MSSLIQDQHLTEMWSFDPFKLLACTKDLRARDTTTDQYMILNIPDSVLMSPKLIIAQILHRKRSEELITLGL